MSFDDLDIETGNFFSEWAQQERKSFSNRSTTTTTRWDWKWKMQMPYRYSGLHASQCKQGFICFSFVGVERTIAICGNVNLQNCLGKKLHYIHPPQFFLAFKFKIPKKINGILLGTNSCLNLLGVWRKGWQIPFFSLLYNFSEWKQHLGFKILETGCFNILNISNNEMFQVKIFLYPMNHNMR